MKPISQQNKPEAPELTPEQEATARAAGGWIQHLGRALKTCRLYDGSNPIVVKFRQDLYASLKNLLSEHGAMTLRFTSEEIECEEVNIYTSRARDDNLALPFHRDGVRGLTFDEGLEPRELDALIDAVLEVTLPTRNKAPGDVDNDLVTLLWEAHLSHIDIDYVPAEGDIVGAGEDESVPWPTPAPAEVGKMEEEASESEEAEKKSTPRSDDWSIGTQTAEIEANFDQLEVHATQEVERFRAEYEAEREAPLVASSLALARAFMASGGRPDDNTELTRFLPRVMRQALVQGNWAQAGKTLDLLRQCPEEDWSIERFTQELLQPISVSSFRERLDHQEADAVDAFVELVKLLGEPAVDLLNLVLAEVQNQRHQRQLSDAIVEVCAGNPERLAPVLSDPRWFVVRNAVQMLGQIGGKEIVGMLRTVAHHPETRIRQEVVAALKDVPIDESRALLMHMVPNADARLFSALLRQLSESRDTETAQMVLEHLRSAEFEKRSPEEQRAIYSTLAAVANDEVLADLEAELYKGNWFSRQQEGNRQAVARCIARIGTPRAKEILERGANSRRGPVRKACEIALGSFQDRE